MHSPHLWVLLGIGIGLLVAYRLGRNYLRGLIYRAAVRTRRELGFHLNPITFTRKQGLKRELLEDPQFQLLLKHLGACIGCK